MTSTINISSEKKGISIFAIKIIASVTMVIDHIGAIFFNPLPNPVQSLILRGIGRIAFILYAFCLAEGFYHTHNKKKYALRLLTAAILVEPVFNTVCVSGMEQIYQSQNVIFTFFIAFCTMWIVEKIKQSERIKIKAVLIIPTVIIGLIMAELIRSEYGCMGVGLVLVFYFLREKKVALFITAFLTYAVGVFIVNHVSELLRIYRVYLANVKKYTEMGEELLLKNTKFGWQQISSAFEITSGDIDYFLKKCIVGPIVALIIIMLYNGKKGRELPKLAFYIFYPAHLMFLYNLNWLILVLSR